MIYVVAFLEWVEITAMKLPVMFFKPWNFEP